MLTGIQKKENSSPKIEGLSMEEQLILPREDGESCREELTPQFQG